MFVKLTSLTNAYKITSLTSDFTRRREIVNLESKTSNNLKRPFSSKKHWTNRKRPKCECLSKHLFLIKYPLMWPLAHQFGLPKIDSEYWAQTLILIIWADIVREALEKPYIWFSDGTDTEIKIKWLNRMHMV